MALKMIAITSPGDFKKQHKAILLQAACDALETAARL